MIEAGLFILGFISGMFSTLLGIGGGLILVPVLVVFFHFPQHISQGISLFCAFFSSGTGSILYSIRKEVNFKVALILEFFALCGGISGANIASIVPSKLLTRIFGISLLFLIFLIIRPNEKWTKKRNGNNYFAGVLGITIAGLLSGSLGIGGGVLKVPVLYILIGLPLKMSISTSNFMVALTTLFTAVVYFQKGFVPLLKIIPIIFGIFIGAFTGTKIQKKVNVSFLRKIFSIVLFGAGINMVLSSFL